MDLSRRSIRIAQNSWRNSSIRLSIRYFFPQPHAGTIGQPEPPLLRLLCRNFQPLAPMSGCHEGCHGDGKNCDTANEGKDERKPIVEADHRSAERTKRKNDHELYQVAQDRTEEISEKACRSANGDMILLGFLIGHDKASTGLV
jgi:hypothetical protein